MSEPAKLGISGRIAQQFLVSEITPLLALVGLLLGIFAVMITPREEEPQINVTFANVYIAYPGATAQEVENLVTIPAEHIAMELKGVKHVYSASSPGMALLTVRFKVGEARNDAIVRIYNAFYQAQDQIPYNLGVRQPIIKPQGIDDVPILSATIWTQNDDMSPVDLTQVAHAMQTEIQRVPGTRDVDIIGATSRVVAVHFDTTRLAAYGLSLNHVRQSLAGANTSANAGQLVNNGQVIQLQAGDFLTDTNEVKDLVVGVYQGAPVFLRDVAEVAMQAEQPQHYVSYGVGPANQFANDIGLANYPALTIAVSKKPGENAVAVANNVIERLNQMRGLVIPDNVTTSISRNYGASAEEKAQTLIKKLIFATLSVILLVLFALGKREAIVVGVAVIITLAITLFASWVWGFTLNRVSLFALIFSIGILVDDAIVVVENIHRHMHLQHKSLREAIPLAVDEVGGPTILATFTVIAALLPMAFVSGLMGPYMAPIPINASTGMLISLAVAFILTPWLFLKLFRRHGQQDAPVEHAQSAKLQTLFKRLLSPFLHRQDGAGKRYGLLALIMTLIILSCSLVYFRAVILKMLPFDNKSEFQIVVDMPEGTSLETTYAALQDIANDLSQLPEVDNYQVYAGTAAPINFNGLVRQYYLRREAYQGDIQVNLVHKSARQRKSHAIALAARELLQASAKRWQANVKVVEMPPGPPVIAPLVAEVYGLDATQRQQTTAQLVEIFANTDDVVDVDSYLEAPQQKWVLSVDRARAAKLGISQQHIVADINAALNGEDVSFVHNEHAKVAIPVRLQLPIKQQADISQLQKIMVQAQDGTLVPLSEVTTLRQVNRDQTIYHKDMLPLIYVQGDVAGATDSPLYGLLAISEQIAQTLSVDEYYTAQPSNPFMPAIKWDGEWQVTFETFRDMGIAYSVGLIMIYLLVVAQFRSYSVPLIIMAPIPLTIIGIMPGHALLGQSFTAPSMIGMIALAGIIVRNSILLVDFIQQQVKQGIDLQTATIQAASVRSMPIILTAVAAMMGGFFILDDPIFGGLAVSLIFGLLVSTVLTLVVIPVVYYHYHWRQVS